MVLRQPNLYSCKAVRLSVKKIFQNGEGNNEILKFHYISHLWGAAWTINNYTDYVLYRTYLLPFEP